jgi:16S rRNA G966 N2-methylase RsmD
VTGVHHEQVETQDDAIVTECFWRQLMAVHGSQRIVRRGTIDIDSGIRQSGHRLVFPSCHGGGIPETTGPTSPGWIRVVTEQGIKQSFDIMTRVMFSRGNISEKIRFGKRLVKKDEMILDMYTGIGYYTLPALIHGKAKHVVACEWNEHAIQALRYNVKDNHLDDRVTIYPGDCRTTAKDQHLVNMFDRVSLGLLPSSEGGWETAVCALKNETGGWLHVHGNVRNAEKETWALWLCQRLLDICQDVGKPSEWIVLGNHVERVKSFAPTVSHFVADVFVGPADGHPRSKDITTTGGTGWESWTTHRARRMYCYPRGGSSCRCALVRPIAGWRFVTILDDVAPLAVPDRYSKCSRVRF